VPVAFINLHHGDHDKNENLDKELQHLIRSKIGPFAKLEKVIFVERLPKTRSGKIVRKLLRDIADQVAVPKCPPTIDDPLVV